VGTYWNVVSERPAKAHWSQSIVKLILPIGTLAKYNGMGRKNRAVTTVHMVAVLGEQRRSQIAVDIVPNRRRQGHLRLF